MEENAQNQHKLSTDLVAQIEEVKTQFAYLRCLVIHVPGLANFSGVRISSHCAMESQYVCLWFNSLRLLPYWPWA